MTFVPGSARCSSTLCLFFNVLTDFSIFHIFLWIWFQSDHDWNSVNLFRFLLLFFMRFTLLFRRGSGSRGALSLSSQSTKVSSQSKKVAFQTTKYHFSPLLSALLKTGPLRALRTFRCHCCCYLGNCSISKNVFFGQRRMLRLFTQWHWWSDLVKVRICPLSRFWEMKLSKLFLIVCTFILYKAACFKGLLNLRLCADDLSNHWIGLFR